MSDGTKIEWPEKMPDSLAAILGRPNFMCSQIASVFRQDGHEIANKAEAEQAFVIHRWVGLWAEHGDTWNEAAARDLKETIARVKAKVQAARS